MTAGDLSFQYYELLSRSLSMIKLKIKTPPYRPDTGKLYGYIPVTKCNCWEDTDLHFSIHKKMKKKKN